MNPTARAKARCYSKTEQDWTHYRTDADGRYVKEDKRAWNYTFASASGHESVENSRFWDASPNGKLELMGVRSDLYEVGQWYYLDFTPTTVEGD